MMISLILSFAFGWGPFASANNNQTPDLTPILPNSDLPFKVRLVQLKDDDGNNFLIPNGIQANVIGTYKGKWLLFDGRTNGLHGFNNNPNNFPLQDQNRVVYVVDPIRKKVFFRSLVDPSSGLTQDQIDSLSVTSPEYNQVGRTLYVAGGYGFRNSIKGFTTFDILSAIDVPGLMQWVVAPLKGDTAAMHIRQIADPIFKITGGDMHKLGKKQPTLLLLGQDFEGVYQIGHSTQVYSEQVRRFQIINDQKGLQIKILPSKPSKPDPNFRRRDLNIVPIISKDSTGKLLRELVALSGVFTPDVGIWTVPITIAADGSRKWPILLILIHLSRE